MIDKDAKLHLTMLLAARIEHGLSEFDAPDLVDAIEALIDERLVKLLREKVAVLEAELRVLYKMPAAINKAMDEKVVGEN